MGKTESGALWLDPQKTSPYEFYQYFRNIDDADVIKCLKILTFLPLEQIEELSHLEGNEINKAKEILAFEVTKLIHGEKEAINAQESARALFSSGTSLSDMPTTVLSQSDFTNDEIQVIDLLLKTKLVSSKGEAKRLIQQNGIQINNEKVSDMFLKLSVSNFHDSEVIIKKGKKVFHKVTL